MQHRAPSSPRARRMATLALVAMALVTNGFSSCAGTTGPLFATLRITPAEVLLRGSLTDGQVAVGLARIDGGEPGDRYRSTIQYGKSVGMDWLSVEIVGRNLTVRANPSGATPGVFLADVRIENPTSGDGAGFRVEFTINP